MALHGRILYRFILAKKLFFAGRVESQKFRTVPVMSVAIFGMKCF